MKYVLLLLIVVTALLFVSGAQATGGSPHGGPPHGGPPHGGPPPGGVVPEPVSSTLFLVGAAALGYRQWKKGKCDK